MEGLASTLATNAVLSAPIAAVGGLLFVIFFGGIIAIVFYIFKSIGVYRISKNLGVKAPGLGWLPLFDWLILGRAADHIRKRDGAAHSGFGGWIFVLSIAVLAGNIAEIVALGKITVNTFMDKINETMTTVAWFLPVVLVVGACSIAVLVLQLIVLGFVYKELSSVHVALFILSLIFSFLIPVFLFAIRKNGMKVVKKEEEVPQFEGLS